MARAREFLREAGHPGSRTKEGSRAPDRGKRMWRALSIWVTAYHVCAEMQAKTYRRVNYTGARPESARCFYREPVPWTLPGFLEWCPSRLWCRKHTRGGGRWCAM